MVKAQKRKVAHPQHQGTRLALDTSLPRSRGAASGQTAEPPCVSFAGWWRSAEAASVLMPLQVYHAASVPRSARGRLPCHNDLQQWEGSHEQHDGRSAADDGAGRTRGLAGAGRRDGFHHGWGSPGGAARGRRAPPQYSIGNRPSRPGNTRLPDWQSVPIGTQRRVPCATRWVPSVGALGGRVRTPGVVKLKPSDGGIG
jgi:hypothetical protein